MVASVCVYDKELKLLLRVVACHDASEVLLAKMQKPGELQTLCLKMDCSNVRCNKGWQGFCMHELSLEVSGFAENVHLGNQTCISVKFARQVVQHSH